MKSGLGSPVVMDTDGKVRWLAPARLDATSSVLTGGGFVVGTGTVDLTRLEFDGWVPPVTVDEPRYRLFHHDIVPGKEGLLAMVDGFSPTGAVRVEAVLAEISPA